MFKTQVEPTLVPEVFLEIFFGKESASPRVRSWHCRLHESEIRGQDNQRVLSLAASRLALSSRRKISRKTSGTRVSEPLSRKVSPPLTSFPSFLNVSFSLYPHESASTWCHWEGSVFTTISLTPRTASLEFMASTHAPWNVLIFVLRLPTIGPLWSMPATCWKSVLFISCDLTIKAIW